MASNQQRLRMLGPEPSAPALRPAPCSQHTHLKHVLQTPQLCLWRTESTWTALLGLLHNCGWRYFSLGSLNKDSRDKFLLKFSSRKCLVSADVFMLPVVSTWKRYNSVLFFSHLSKQKKSNKKYDPNLLSTDKWEYLIFQLLLDEVGFILL